VRLRQVAAVGLHGVRDAQAQVLELRAQGLSGDAQQEGGRGGTGASQIPADPGPPGAAVATETRSDSWTR
jgi:hypothetical protein